MTPSEASAASENTPQAVSCVLVPKISVLKNRADYLALNRAQRQAMPTMVVQGRDRQDGSEDVRVGFTCSKKVGNAVVRNRAKRRLREVARLHLASFAQPGWDYALIGRAGATATRPFSELETHLERALRMLHSSS
ncbi:MAG: ribonuclease P protein component [Pseudomonadota bacterium]